MEDMNAMELRIAQKDAALADMETEVHRSAQVSEQRQSGEILRRTREIEEHSLWSRRERERERESYPSFIEWQCVQCVFMVMLYLRMCTITSPSSSPRPQRR